MTALKPGSGELKDEGLGRKAKLSVLTVPSPDFCPRVVCPLSCRKGLKPSKPLGDDEPTAPSGGKKWWGGGGSFPVVATWFQSVEVPPVSNGHHFTILRLRTQVGASKRKCSKLSLGSLDVKMVHGSLRLRFPNFVWLLDRGSCDFLLGDGEGCLGEGSVTLVAPT